METIYLKERIPAENGRYKTTHYEIVVHNGKKFLIYVEGSNGDCLGFNNKCCLSVMNENGSWDKVADNHQLGFSPNNDNMYYGTKVEVKKKYVDMNVNEFKDYISKVY